MSTLAYATMTNRRDAAEPGTSTDTGKPGMKSVVDALAALVPAEVLAAHAVILGFTTQKAETPDGATTITEPDVLSKSFWALLIASAVLYAFGRANNWDRWDVVRVFIPPFAFVGWTMAQNVTAFDAAMPDWTTAGRYATAVIGSLLLGGIATALAYKADQKPTGE